MPWGGNAFYKPLDVDSTEHACIPLKFFPLPLQSAHLGNEFCSFDTHGDGCGWGERLQTNKMKGVHSTLLVQTAQGELTHEILFDQLAKRQNTALSGCY